MTRKLLGLIAFVSTGAGLMVSSIIKDMNLLNTGFLAIIGFFLTISLVEHFNELKN